MPAIITLLTDFGVESTYPAQMKGVILGRCPTAVIVDMSHGVPHHNVHTAAFMLASAAPAFDAGAIHVAVVDPQVGSQRRILAAEACGHIYLAPDNGLLTLVTQGGFSARATRRRPRSTRSRTRGSSGPRCRARSTAATSSPRWRPPWPRGPRWPTSGRPSRPSSDSRCPCRTATATASAARSSTSIPSGTSSTNVPGTMLAGAEALRVRICGAVIQGLSRAYSDVPGGMLLAYVGSAGLLEIAVNRQSAAVRLGAGIGTPLTVTFAP